jgi:A/G-specific adenine glycosylase
MKFSNLLIQWYLYKRDLPWRNTTNPYPILSEIMLQTVAQGMPYYFYKRFSYCF